MNGKGELMTNQSSRIHVIYFLSRMGRIEHPHLIQVHHISLNGVYLRDVKKWLSDLRGEDMPNSFAWSCKRKYKDGYVWQDLVDDDLITPIAYNEFVLKGSEISSVQLDRSSYGEKRRSSDPIEDKSQKPFSGKVTEITETKVEVSSKAFEIEINEETSEVLDSETPKTTDDSMKSEAINPKKEEKKREKKNKKTSKSNSSGASNVFRNILTCGAINTNDSALTTITPIQRRSTNPPETMDGSGDCNPKSHEKNSRKSSNGMKNSNTTNDEKKASKPTEPKCSQCGKQFKPEKLHSHMKSCKGMKNLSKFADCGSTEIKTAPEKASLRRSTDTSTYFLTGNHSSF